ncbi:hypothetical protein [Nannocystis bainbridge]|uniref:Uncharacterized protein n=1 Tax=Nannocystis bainbridge TaxID=2995303 RepID=A0ABT5E1Y5_9BACT|nr:hypothetical protein [Nannocystis bainbridge]MDC0719858.1 hypothetical protein [Nannocystis bainbridge]
MWTLVFAGLFFVWNLQASLRRAHERARGRGGGPVLGPLIANSLMLATAVVGVFVRAEALGRARPWGLLVITAAVAVGHWAAIVGIDRLGTRRREWSGA